MLERLELHNVGPAPEMILDLAKRVNLITGDNGLGKSFLLDVAWWSLTRRWPREVNRRMTSGHPARPRDAARCSKIRFRVRHQSVSDEISATFHRADQTWVGEPGGSLVPGFVVYAHADGSFSVWDSARNYWPRQSAIRSDAVRLPYVFTEAEVWDGLRSTAEGRSTPVCNGLLYDWSKWVQADDLRIPETWLRPCGHCLRVTTRPICSSRERRCACRWTIRATSLPSGRSTRDKCQSFMRRLESAELLRSPTC